MKTKRRAKPKPKRRRYRRPEERALAALDREFPGLMAGSPFDPVSVHRALFPKESLIAVWHVEFSIDGHPQLFPCLSYKSAEQFGLRFQNQYRGKLVTITGPHQHRVAT